MISERILKKWRRESLRDANPMMTLSNNKVDLGYAIQRVRELSVRINKLTLELLDQHLLKK
uniref:Uncharacterized protein n=1 Tax=viral metagenome TaxID=1070528 RepID=A0A6H1ZRW6_9ZZZZ